MSKRIDNLKYEGNSTPDLFIDSPAEFLCKTIAEELLKVPQWVEVFGDRIDPYKRMDYQISTLPGLRIYNNQYTKEFESWFVEGDIQADIIYPASIRRRETQQLQDTVSAALLQQFRRPTFFDTLCSKNPGLNELGKRYSVDKSLGFEWNDTLVPLTQVTINFRTDLRQWDVYLEGDNRTKDDPFERTLGNLKRVVYTLQALKADAETEEEVEEQTDLEIESNEAILSQTV